MIYLCFVPSVTKKQTLAEWTANGFVMASWLNLTKSLFTSFFTNTTAKSHPHPPRFDLFWVHQKCSSSCTPTNSACFHNHKTNAFCVNCPWNDTRGNQAGPLMATNGCLPVHCLHVCCLHLSQIKDDCEEFLWIKGRNHNKHLFPFCIPHPWPINSLQRHNAHSRPLIFHFCWHKIAVYPCFLSVFSLAAAHVEHFQPLVTVMLLNVLQ